MSGEADCRRIDPDHLEDAEWDALMDTAARPSTPALGIGNHVADAWGALWRVDAARITSHDFAIYLGRPVQASGPQGAAVIITVDLKAYLEAHRRSPDLIDLPIGRGAIQRLRRVLGHNWYEDGERWWLHRMRDLETLTTADFAVRHGVKPAAVTYARLNILGPRQRPAGWWRDLTTADLILSPQPRIYVAQMLGIAAASVGRYRAELRRERGEPMDRKSALARMADAKRGVPAHPATRAALLDAAKRPKSKEWRAALSERNRARERPSSWVEREWTSEEDAQLGTAPDRAVAERIGRTIPAVRARRAALRIPAFARK